MILSNNCYITAILLMLYQSIVLLYGMKAYLTIANIQSNS